METSFIYNEFKDSANWLKKLKYVNVIKSGIWHFLTEKGGIWFVFSIALALILGNG